jgi:hypothetical protein
VEQIPRCARDDSPQGQVSFTIFAFEGTPLEFTRNSM